MSYVICSSYFTHRTQPYLSCCVVHYFFSGQVTLVAHQKLVNVFTGIAVNFLKPLLDIVIGLLHSENNNIGMALDTATHHISGT